MKDLDQVLFNSGEPNNMYMAFDVLFNNRLEGATTMWDMIHATKEAVKGK